MIKMGNLPLGDNDYYRAQCACQCHRLPVPTFVTTTPLMTPEFELLKEKINLLEKVVKEVIMQLIEVNEGLKVEIYDLLVRLND